ncbi:MAG: CRISPR-associated protein Cas4 [Atribacterota bacterium]
MKNTITHSYIEPHQVNSFVYCKRQWYLQKILKLSLINEDMRIGKYIGDSHWLNTKKRKEVYITSSKLKMKSKIDYVISEEGKQIPIEIKKGKCKKKPKENDIMQLLCEILLLEEHFNTKYHYGYLLYVGSRKKFKVPITLGKYRSLTLTLEQIRSYLRNGKSPEIKMDKNKCRNCSLNIYCLPK